MLTITSFNANGIRAAARKGFFEWLKNNNIDVLCIQETKAQLHQLDDEIFKPLGYHRFFFDAEKKGYSGTAIYCKQKPDDIRVGLGFDLADTEGRYIEAVFGNTHIGSLYLPSGSSSDERQQLKYVFLDKYTPMLLDKIKSGKSHIICGDFNIVHKEIDIKNWKANQKSSGCLPEERAWLDLLFDEQGWVDGFRAVNQEKDQYTWWSNRGRARENNVGWRIDYHMVTPNLADKIVSADIYKDAWFSDHAPLTLQYDLNLG